MTKSKSPDWELVKKAHQAGTVKIELLNDASLRSWMKGNGWKSSWIFLEESFKKQLLSEEWKYRQALEGGIVEIMIPKDKVNISGETLKDLDESYEERSWSSLVESLRDMRRAVEAGVILEVEGKPIKTWNAWYSWAHSRYPGLEEGSDLWIGDDRGSWAK
ncbi:MAG: hypothetical protein KDC53_24055 [Saprospiraceae bacterium]|nr:hypothetical protein [Saprospiraceae bacterium]